MGLLVSLSDKKMCGFLTEKFLLKEVKVLHVFLENEICSNGYSITGLFFMFLVGWVGWGLYSSHQLKRIKFLLYYSSVWNSGGIIRAFLQNSINLLYTFPIICSRDFCYLYLFCLLANITRNNLILSVHCIRDSALF